MNNNQGKKYDLEERTARFAKKVRDYIKTLPRTVSNIEYSKQLVRSSGSVAANYIEANESLGDKDFKMKIKTCKKEAKESKLWLDLTEPTTPSNNLKLELIDEAEQLVKIFFTILRNST